jgi:hypothetical protein
MHAIETYGVVWIQLRLFLIPELNRVECSASRPSRLVPGSKALIILWTGDLVDTKAGLGVFGEDKNFLHVPGFKTRSNSPQTNDYTDRIIPALRNIA